MDARSFQTDFYQRHNKRRQEHLSYLSLPIAGKSVLEVGAGIGDHTSFFTDRNCYVTSTDGRGELLKILRNRHPQIDAFVWDVEAKPSSQIPKCEVVYCYGLLYHTSKPALVIEHLSSVCSDILLIETAVSFGSAEKINLTAETSDHTQALRNVGCRPTRNWLFNSLRKHFKHVYVSKSQPWHEEFPTDWSKEPSGQTQTLSRAIFIASRSAIKNSKLSDKLLDKQTRS